MSRSLLAAALILGVGAPLAAQDPGAATEAVVRGAYADARAAELVRLARSRRDVVGTRITAYEATAHERFTVRLGVAGLEKLLFRRETVARIDWGPDTVRIEVLGSREAQPLVGGEAQRPPPSIAGMMPALAFDPVDSGVLLRIDTSAVRHPLAPGSEARYRFSTGDSTTIRLPDGRQVRIRELRFAARRPDPRLINGSLWIDLASHAVVRTTFRLARSSTGPGLTVLAPEVAVEVDVAVDYGLWDLRWWMPRTLVGRGVVRLAGARLPLVYERSYSEYTITGDTTAAAPPAADTVPATRPCRPPIFGSLEVRTGEGEDPADRDSAWEAGWERAVARVAGDTAEGDTAGDPAPEAPAPDPPAAETASARDARDGRPPCDRLFLVTRAPVDLARSPVFTAGVYEAQAGPVREEDLRELGRLLEDLPDPRWALGPPALRLLTPELVRYNRVEGLSLGAGAALPLGPAELRAELRAGTTGEVGGRVALLRPTPTHTAEVAAYRRVESITLAPDPFSLSGSAGALLLGRDENDYFRGTGAEVRVRPSTTRRQTWDLRLFAERQEPLRARSDATLRGLFDAGFAVRPNLAADPARQAGGTLRLRTARGDDPAGMRARAVLELHAETGDRSFARPLLRLGADRRFGDRLAARLALAGGIGLGDVPPQRAWQIGGASTVRGHDPAALRGEALWLARGEVSWGPPSFRLSAFGDVGWAGAADGLRAGRPLRGAGVGIAALDNLFRVDVAHGLGGGLRVHAAFAPPW